MNLPSISIPQALDLWADIEDAYQGINQYGGDELEVYAYRLVWTSPSGYAGVHSREESTRLQEEAAETLTAIVLRFCERRNCRAYLSRWKEPIEITPETPIEPFSHRTHIRVVRGESDAIPTPVPPPA